MEIRVQILQLGKNKFNRDGQYEDSTILQIKFQIKQNLHLYVNMCVSQLTF